MNEERKLDPTGEMPALTLERIAELRRMIASNEPTPEYTEAHIESDLRQLLDLAERAMKQPLLTRGQVKDLYVFYGGGIPGSSFKAFYQRLRELGIGVIG